MYIVKNTYHKMIFYLLPVTYAGAEAAGMTFHIVYPYDGKEFKRCVLVKSEEVGDALEARMKELEKAGWVEASVEKVVFM